MASGRYFKVLALPWLLSGLAMGAQATDTDCAPGSSLVSDLRQARQRFGADENAAVWQAAFECDWRPIIDEKGDGAISQFEVAARDNGLGGGLRTFARNGDFLLFLDGKKPLPLDSANHYLDGHELAGSWLDSARGVSPDSNFLFAVGEVSLSRGRRFQYLEVWQFDPKVANWGIKSLLLNPVPKK